MAKRLLGKKEQRRTIKSHQSITAAIQKEHLPMIFLTVLLLGSTFRQPMKADSVSSGIFGGAATGALVGGLAGGGRGAGYGALAGAALGGIMGSASQSSSRSSDPYYLLEKEERKLRKLEDRYDRASDRKRASLERQIETQRGRVMDLRSRLNIR